MNPPSQNADYAFTVRGNAYELETAYKDRAFPMLVTAYAPSSNSVDAFVSLEKCPTTINATAEATDPRVGQSSHFVVMGVIPIIHITGPEPAPLNVRGAVGKSIPPSFVRPDVGRPAVRVAAPLKDTAPVGGIRLYALVDQNSETGLCHALAVGQEKVYYFSEYRTDATSRNGRKKEWNEKVSEKSIISPEADYKGWIPGPAFECDPLEREFHKLRLQLSKYTITSKVEDLDDAREALKAIATSTFDESPLLILLAKFLAMDYESFDDADAETLTKYIQKQWPAVRHVAPEKLTFLHDGLRKANIKLRLRTAYLFLALACPMIAEVGQDAIDIEEISKNVKHILGPDASVPVNLSPPTISNIDDYIQSLKTQVKKHQDRVKITMESLRAQHGTNVMPPDVLFRRIQHSVDLDVNRALHDQAASYWSHEYSRASRAVIGILQDLLSDLDDLSPLPKNKDQ
jgi:hypothetical protein